ncbi:cellulase family glycosylhydrolase [Flavobacterium piscis]|uniref:Aryl-phospho-beta-D-glucosidase BglC (GH1 family) n=1 Tax=Flavobacterium piscis TaxID=1114874 RepID=A0ABU1Y8Z8_9FLAO|nr:cellulase family glycosylhydrolase [Flavobacterium piscis]MDR7210710.1 aryl-phospho-beta-D-glucosidase BglC (GH1 family) [Flavobacterium piscis]
MRLKHFYRIVLLLIVTGFSVSCSKNDDEDPQLVVSATTVSFEPEGGTSEEITIDANSEWSVSNPATSWLQLTKTSGASGTTVIKLIALKNETLKLSRSVVLTVDANNGQTRRITIKQRANFYPSYNLEPKAPDATDMSSTAVELAAKMHLGINFGNTMVTPEEGVWNAKVTESYVKFVKGLGFNTVRLSVGWVWGHLSDPDKMKVDPEWLERVHEVVGWCVKNDMYVVLNAHADLGWLEDNVTLEMEESVNAKQKALWEQIATTMRDFDERLIFAGTNEPKVDTPEQMAILNGYHETFIKAVRATGGKNSYRVLVVQGPITDSHKTYNLMNTLPHDPVPNRMMVEIHSYTPSTFTLLTDEDVSWGKMAYYWGTDNHSTIEPLRNAIFGEEDSIISEFQKMKEKFVDKGIPVILGEYASWRRTADLDKPVPLDTDKHNKSVDYWAKYVTKQAKLHGIVPYWWEIGFMLDRANDKVKDQAMLDAIIEGYNQ